MPQFHFTLKNNEEDLEKVLEFDLDGCREALNVAVNALALFMSSKLPPPPEASIVVSDAEGRHLAKMCVEFKIEYMRSFIM